VTVWSRSEPSLLRSVAVVVREPLALMTVTLVVTVSKLPTP
jgi:hypothetical protein